MVNTGPGHPQLEHHLIISSHTSTSKTVSLPQAAGAEERHPSAPAKAGPDGTNASASATVTLSEASRKAVAADIPAASISQESDVDMARVQRVADAIRDGQYAVDTSKIAEGLLADVRDLLA